MLTVEDRERFQKNLDLGCYVGLRPKQSESGQSRPQLRITKEGDRYLRTLLVQGRTPTGIGVQQLRQECEWKPGDSARKKQTFPNREGKGESVAAPVGRRRPFEDRPKRRVVDR